MKKAILLSISYNEPWFFEFPVNKSLIFTNTFKRGFSGTTLKKVKSGGSVLSEVDKLLEKSRVFEKNLNDLKAMTEKHTLLEAKAKLSTLREVEWSRQTKFIETYMPYLNAEERKKVDVLLDKGERFDTLVKEKLDALNISKESNMEDLKKFTDYSSFDYSGKNKTFSGIEEVFKSHFDQKGISSAEKDVFNILLAKRNEEKKAFYDFTNNHFAVIKDKINIALKQSMDSKPTAFKPDKVPLTETKEVSSVADTPLHQTLSDAKSSVADATSSFSDKPVLPDEALEVIQELLNYFS